MLWVTSSTDSPSVSTTSRSWRMNSAWLVTSRALVGSSASSSVALLDSAMATATRWHMPPLSWWG